MDKLGQLQERLILLGYDNFIQNGNLITIKDGISHNSSIKGITNLFEDPMLKGNPNLIEDIASIIKSFHNFKINK